MRHFVRVITTAIQIRQHINELEPQKRLQVELEAIKSTPSNISASPPSPKPVIARRISQYFRALKNRRSRWWFDITSSLAFESRGPAWLVRSSFGSVVCGVLTEGIKNDSCTYYA